MLSLILAGLGIIGNGIMLLHYHKEGNIEGMQMTYKWFAVYITIIALTLITGSF